MKYRTSPLLFALAAAFPGYASAEDAAAPELERVVITGSNIRVTQKEGPSAVQVITAKDLEGTGKTSVADVLRAISANSGNSYNEQYTGSFSAGTAGRCAAWASKTR
jgi:iron complex outermembrane receptor protein